MSSSWPALGTVALALALGLGLSGCGMGWGLKDLNATIAANVCAGVKVEHTAGEGWEVSASVSACGKASALGLPLPEVCVGLSTEPPP